MRRSVFISHSWSYSGHYDTLSKWIFEEEWCLDQQKILFSDTSVPKDNPIHFANTVSALQAAIDRRIIISEVVVIPAGMYASYSKWIQKEISSAQRLSKPILAVNPWAQERKSSVVIDAADDNCGWNKQSVINKVWGLPLK